MSDPVFRLYAPDELGGRPRVLPIGSALVIDLREVIADRFMRKVELPADPCACWVWKASVRADGYGQFAIVKGATWRAHRVAYLLRHGGMPSDEFVLDHLCRNRACVNPDHLDPVTRAENARRGVAARLGGSCKRGHPRSPENTYSKGSHHECRVCHRERERRRRCRA